MQLSIVCVSHVSFHRAVFEENLAYFELNHLGRVSPIGVDCGRN